MSAPARQQQLPPPQDLPAEQGVLGACLLFGGDVVGNLVDILRAEDFYSRGHGLIWSAAVNLWDRGTPVDEITVTAYLRDQGSLADVGGATFLAELANIVITESHAEHYARMVVDKSRLRALEAEAQRILTSVRSGQDAAQVLDFAQATVNRIAMDGARGGEAVPCAKSVPLVLGELEERCRVGHDPQATPFGFSALDEATGGMLPGEVITAAGASSMGKTSWALGVAANVAVRQGKTVLFVSKEQTVRRLTGWFLCRECRVDTLHWRTGKLNDWERRQLSMKRDELASAPLHWLAVDSTGPAALRAVSAAARRLQGRSGLALVVVDYLQLFAASDDAKDISAMSHGLKGMAQRLNLPLISLSQFSRELDRQDRKGHLPKLSDLYGSGSIEKDSDIILFVYRPAFYDPKHPDKRLAVVVPAKFREGVRGTENQVDMRFIPECVRFEDARQGEPQGGLF